MGATQALMEGGRVGSSGAGSQGSKRRVELAAVVFCQPLQQQSLPYAALCPAARSCEPHTVVGFAAPPSCRQTAPSGSAA